MWWALMVGITFTSLAGLPSATRPPDDVVLIMRREPGEPVTPRTAARLFLKEKLFWHDGTRIFAVNLPANHQAREAFEKRVLKRSRRELLAFWNEEHFNGVNPPVVLESEEAVKAFVRQVDGAVGYIRREQLDPDLKVLLTLPMP